MHRRIITACTAAAASVALLFTAATSAHAGETTRACNGGAATYGACSGEAVFDDTDWVFQGVTFGERVNVDDNKADSHGVQVYVYWNADGEQKQARHVCNAGAGKGCYFYHKIAEGTRVGIQVCLTENSEEINRTCGPLSYGRA